ncbi:MAG TPA: tryptophan 2,3-dioxygenase family protein [Blastocatellia bacterium]|nr:tryptophan 2,3-dioxygenase family protein [Blastocatellia bacterium]
MSFGIKSGEAGTGLTYGGYLKLPELLSLQHLLSSPPQPDEMLFIVIHQVYELWFKELLNEIDAVIGSLNRDEPLEAHRLLGRCISIERVMVYQIDVLETMAPQDFLNFRDHLMPASGFQSAQFREIEISSGLKELRFLGYFPTESDEHIKLQARLERPSLKEAFYGLLKRRGFDLTDEGGADCPSGSNRIEQLLSIYQESAKHYELYLLVESLIEYDEMFAMWRLRHIKMVERMIGSKTGTGGSQGAAYLRTTTDTMFFPELWELRTYISNKSSSS